MARESEDKIHNAIADARLRNAKARHAPPNTKGKSLSALLLDLLERTWTEWCGYGRNHSINSRAIPPHSKRDEMARLCRETRAVVNELLDKIEKELNGCSQKTIEPSNS